MSASGEANLPGSIPEWLRMVTERRDQIETELREFEAEAAKHVAQLKRGLEFYNEIVARTADAPLDVHPRLGRPHVPSESSKDGHVVLKSGSNGTPRKAGDRSARDNKTQRVLEFLDGLIEELGHPVTKGLLMDRLEASGYKLDVTDPRKFVQKTLWRSDKFEFLGVDKGWWIKGTPVPPE